MLISALNDYYDILNEQGKLSPKGYDDVKIHYLISLTDSGKIDSIINWKEKEIRLVGKKEKEFLIPREVSLPVRSQKTGIDGNVIEHRPLYIFGLNFENGLLSPEDKTNKARKSHEIFVETNLEFLENLDSPMINAYREFLKKYMPTDEIENPHILSIGKEYKTSGFAFCLSGRPDILLHEDILIKKKWSQRFSEIDSEEEASVHCAISGEKSSIARIHKKIKGFNAMGSSLIGYNDEAFCSYGNEQAYNSNISIEVMERYTESLNYLLSSREHKTNIDDTTILYFTMDKNQDCTELFNMCMFENSKLDDEETQTLLATIMKEAVGGNIAAKRLDVLSEIDEGTIFYMFGLRPNSSRLALKFIYRQKFSTILYNIALHQMDLQLAEGSKTILFWKMLSELKPTTNKKVEVDPALTEKIMQAIIYGYRYPNALLHTIVRRIKTDPDTDMYRKINATRVSIIKAYINRQQRLSGKKEEFTMALNQDNTNKAYLCGRMFAVLEQLQQGASGGNLNRTIKDSYFASACSTPAIVFPKLLRLAQNHIPKATYGQHLNYEIGKIMNLLESEFPTTLSLVEQGTFIVGYYQQFYKKHEKADESLSELKMEEE